MKAVDALNYYDAVINGCLRIRSLRVLGSGQIGSNHDQAMIALMQFKITGFVFCEIC